MSISKAPIEQLITKCRSITVTKQTQFQLLSELFIMFWLKIRLKCFDIISCIVICRHRSLHCQLYDVCLQLLALGIMIVR